MLAESSDFASGTPYNVYVSDEIPQVIRTELNAEMDRDLLARMRYLARKKRMARPDITDDEMADYLALAENFQNCAQWISARRLTLQSPVRANAGWMTATVIIVGLLTAMLMVTIAITV